MQPFEIIPETDMQWSYTLLDRGLRVRDIVTKGYDMDREDHTYRIFAKVEEGRTMTYAFPPCYVWSDVMLRYLLVNQTSCSQSCVCSG